MAVTIFVVDGVCGINLFNIGGWILILNFYKKTLVMDGLIVMVILNMF